MDWNQGKNILVILMVLTVLPSVLLQCTFPTTMVDTGTWTTSTRGSWTVNSSSIDNFNVNWQSSGATDSYTFECYNQTTDGYFIIKSTTVINIFGGSYIYVCLKLDVSSASLLKYYLLTSAYTVTAGVEERLRIIQTSSSPSSNADVCTDANTFTNQERLHVAVASNNTAGAKSSFPCNFQATFSYHDSVASCNESSVDVCESSIVFDYTKCTETQLFSLNGTLSNIYYSSTTSGGTTTYFMYLYNDDSISPDGSTYYQFSCMIFAVTGTNTGSQVSATVNPNVCLDSTSQTSTSITGTSGYAITFTNLGTSTCADGLCTTTSTSTAATTTATPVVASASLTWLYVVIAIGVILLIVLILIAIFCCIRKRKRTKVEDEESPIIKEDNEKNETEEQKEEEKDKKEDQKEDIDAVPTTSKKDAEEDQRSVDSGFIGKEEDSPLPAGEDEKEIEEKQGEEGEEGEDEETEETEVTKFVVEETEKEDENLNTEAHKEVEKDEETVHENLKEDGNDKANIENEEMPEEKDENDNQEEDEKSTKDEENQDQQDNRNETMSQKEEQIEKESQEVTENLDADDEESGDETAEEEREPKVPVLDIDDGDNESVVVRPQEADENIDKTEQTEESTDNTRKSQDAKSEDFEEKNAIENQENAPTEPCPDDNELRNDDKEDRKTESEESFDNESDDGDYISDGKVDEDGNPIRVGFKKRSGKFMPKGTLTNVLVTRHMEEQKRKKSHTKKKGKGMRSFAKGKSHKLADKEDKGSDSDSQGEDIQQHEKGTRAAFMAQYEHKKQIEKELEEQHYWSEEKEDFNYENDFEFDVFPDDKKENVKENDSAKENVAEKTQNKEGYSVTENKKQEDRNVLVTKGLLLENQNKINDLGGGQGVCSQKEPGHENGKDSGMETGGESPKLKSENDVKRDTEDDKSDDDLQDISSNSEYDEFDLPPGLIRDGDGRVIRESDGHVVSDSITEKEYKKARLGKLFNIPRLKRTKSGRPTGGFVEDKYGPTPNDKNSFDFNGESDDVPNMKQRRHSNSIPVVSDLGVTSNSSKSGGKNVMFDFPGNELDLPCIATTENGKKDRRSVSSACRRLLKKRLFKQKSKQGQSGVQMVTEDGDNEHPRELNSLVKVYGRQNSQKDPISPPPNLQRQVSGRVMDQGQMQRNREGLATDWKILDKLSTHQNGRPFPPKNAFMDQNDNITEEGALNNVNNQKWTEKRDNFDIGNDDEFVLVGKEHDQESSRLFTMVQHPNDNEGLLTQKSFDASFLRHQHEKRHAIPWSLLNYGPSREPTKNDLRLRENIGGSKSAGASRENIDDRRLKELLEELYRDKKYFDHVVETTDPDDKSDIDERDLAEHGRDFLLDRAEFWETREPLPRRPPPTALGMRLSRMQTNLESGRVSIASTTSSQIPHIGVQSIPGQIDSDDTNNKRENTVV